MPISNRRIVELLAGSDARSTATWVRDAMREQGPVETELDDWFVNVNADHTKVAVELDGNPDLAAEMPVEEFFGYLDAIAQA